MKILHIMRSKPNDLVQTVVRRAFEGQQKTEVALYAGPVDYDKLVKQVFEHDKVICWW